MNAHTTARLLPVFLIALPVATSGQAARQDTSRIVPLDSVRVTVTRGTVPLERMPAAASVVGIGDIRGGQATVGLDESLDRIPGVFVNNRYNFSLGARISMRGLGSRAAFGVRGVRVMADGIPLTMPDGQSNLNNLELGAAGRIDVVRGPASALYGNAAGGVISIETEAAPQVFSTEARALGGNAGRDGFGLGRFFKLQAKAGGRLHEGGFVGSVSHMQTEGYRNYSAAEQTLLNVVARHPIGEASRLSVVVNAFDSPVAESPGALPIDSVRRNPRMAWPANARTLSGEATTQLQVGVGIAHILGNTRLDISAYALGRDVDNALAFGFIDLSRRAGGLRATYAGSPAGERVAVTAGVDVEWQSDDRREFDNVNGGPGDELRRDQRDQVFAIAPFAQTLVQLAPRADLLLGVRYDAVRFETSDAFMGDARDDSGNRTLSALSPMAGLTFAASERIRLYGNVATAFQTPTTTELINAPPEGSTPCCPGGFNADLDPQRALSFEVGARGRVGRFAIDFAAYHMNVDRTIVPFQVADGEGREFFRNAGESRHRGLELSASTPLGRHLATLAYTFNDFVFIDDGDSMVDFEGNRLPGVPRHHVFAGLRLRPADALQVDIEVDHTGEYFANDANEDSAVNDAATVVDLRLQYDTRLGGIAARPFLAVGNLTNTRYNSSVVVNAFGRRYYEPAPRRSFHVGFAVATGAWPGN
jgi:iron complex outermembrane receptor protein